ncbi:PD-(D/E)XK nuclease superfamily protein [Pseudomonas sp. AG1028]|uniref:PDDEXK-like family protein n=1 Tax=Pseudomonas sp. AG1028 TaxID=2572911 RepID=UPI0011AC4D60|nr:PD-(D/E)XK nuclease family protein [Pseudomonas sp. AG1028]TWE05802.1 PD-(D/E)XK nuclease superfamily protein [Pseudomonas sp. AG1028]
MDATTEAVEEFLCDPKLSELCEILKISDDIFDVIKLSENQHSDFLAWLFDPREGHGQGDQIVRDLLISATQAAAESGLDGRSTTSRFFAEWPPSKIRTTSFGSIFTARELGLKASERVDLFVIDPNNKFVLLIENKAGTTHSQQQLDGYRTSWQEAVANSAHLKDYRSVHIALDRDFAGGDWSERPSTGYWLHLGYDWLKASADRALMHVERGNAAAKLVVSYCNRQTDWESPISQRAVTLAAELHQAHGPAVRHMLESNTGRLEKCWLQEGSSTHMSFMLQNKAAFDLLRDTQGMASIKETLLVKIPGFKRENVYHARAWLSACPPNWEQFMGENSWPVYFRVRYADSTKTKYDIALVFDSASANSETEGKQLRERLKLFDNRFGKRQGTSLRKVVLNRGLGLADLIRKLEEHSNRLKTVCV